MPILEPLMVSALKRYMTLRRGVGNLSAHFPPLISIIYCSEAVVMPGTHNISDGVN